jgi:hypothetical protein
LNGIEGAVFQLKWMARGPESTRAHAAIKRIHREGPNRQIQTAAKQLIDYFETEALKASLHTSAAIIERATKLTAKPKPAAKSKAVSKSKAAAKTATKERPNQ